jgi:hypothetical protein
MTVRLQYAFDEGSGTTFAEASAGPTGNLVTGTWVTGHTGTGLQSNSSSVLAGRVGTLGGSAIISSSAWTALTVMCWTKLGAVDGQFAGIQFSNRAGADSTAFGQNPSGVSGHVSCWLFTNSADSEVDVASGVTTGAWYHHAYTWSTAGTLRMYVNGAQVGSTALAGSNLGGDIRYIQIGKVDEAWSTAPQQPIDDFRIFDSAEDASSITTWMNTPVGGAAVVPRSPFLRTQAVRRANNW